MKSNIRKLTNQIRNDRFAQLAHMVAKAKQKERSLQGKLKAKKLALLNAAKKHAAAQKRHEANPAGLYFGVKPLNYIPGCKSEVGDVMPYIPVEKKLIKKVKENTLLALAKLPNMTVNPYIRLEDGTWKPRVKVPVNMVSELDKMKEKLKPVVKDGVFNLHWTNKVVQPLKSKTKSVWYTLKRLYGRVHSPTDPNGYICSFRPGAETYYPEVTVPCEMSAEKAQTFVKLFAKQPRMREGDLHDHPLCANVRWLAQKYLEEEMDNICLKNDVQPCYLDCFGSARFQENKNKWSAQPIITVGDSQRLRGKRCCNCNPTECKHIVQSVSFSVDSVYYMNPEQIATLCANTKLKQHHVLFHRMLTHTGSYLNGEYRWTTVKCNDELFNKVWIGGKDTGNIYQSKLLDWLNVRAWPTSKGWLYYSFKKNVGVMESGFFLLSEKKLIHTPVEQSDDTIDIISWEMDGPERNGNWYTSIRDWIKTNVFQLIGVVNRYKLVKFKVPTSLYTKLVQCAIFSDVAKRMDLIPELKGVARRWKSDQEQRGIYLDEMYFIEYLPHVIAAALTVSLPAEFGALHKNYINDYFVQNKGLWRQSYSQAGRLCVTLAAFTATIGVLSFGITTWASVLTLVAAGCAACIALLKGKEKEQGIKSSFILRSSICHGTDIEGFYDFLMAIPVQRLPIELKAIPGFTDILSKQMTKRNKQSFLNIIAPLLSQYKTECGCAFSDERKKTICSFVDFEGIEPRCMVNCTCNFISAMTQRYFRITPMQDENLWEQKSQTLITTGSKFLDRNLNVDEHRPAWYKKLATHKKKAVDRALTSGDNKGYHFVNPSVKQEITLSQTAANKAYKPRVFFPKNNLHFAETGPYMYALKKMLNRNMDGVKNPVLFACGYNPLELGDALQTGLNKWLPNDTLRLAFECDLKTCESTMCGYIIPLEAQLCKVAGVPTDIINKLYDKDFCSGVYQRAISKETISFKMKNCRESGTTNTSVGNSLIYTTILTQSLNDMGVNQYFLLVGGDDAVIYHYKCDYDRMKEVFNQVKRYGLEPETVFRKNYLSARFYSGFFLPCLYKKQEHWIHTLSVGKAFVKAFNYRVKPDLHPETWLKETAKQREVMWNHCPILNLVPEFVAKQLADVKVKNQQIHMDLGGFMYDDRMKYSVEESKETKHVLASIYDMDITEIDSLEKDLRNQFEGDWYGRKISSIGLTRMLDLDL